MIEVPLMTDAHVHLRDGDMAYAVAPYSYVPCRHIIVMPNTIPPIHDPDRIEHLQRLYTDAIGMGGSGKCTVHMTAKWLPRTTMKDVRDMKAVGVIGLKLYPQGATTNSDDGIPFEDLVRMVSGDHFNEMPRYYDVLCEMQHQDMVLLCHGEASASTFVMNRENAFLPVFEWIAAKYPRLRMTLEHISTAAGVRTISDLNGSRPGKVLGTITAHHMMLTLDDIVGGKLQPDNFCMPIPKTPYDRHYLLAAAKSAGEFGGRCFALGSDSAPHLPAAKYCAAGCAGVFSAPVLAETLMEIFNLSTFDYKSFVAFTSINANDFYGFGSPKSAETLKCVRDVPWRVSKDYQWVTPFRTGQTITWQAHR